MKLIEDLRAHRDANPHKRYPKALQREVVAHFASALARGEHRRDIAEQLGVPPSTIDLWRKAKRENARANFSAVKVETENARGIVVHAGAVRIEGASIEEIVKLLRALGC